MSEMQNKRKKVQFRGNTDNVVTLTIDDLDDLVYTASFRAANKAMGDLYKGLSNAYLNRLDDDVEMILDEIEQIKLQLRNSN